MRPEERSMSPPVSINLDGLAKPATALVEKISNAIGVLYESTKIRKLAKAKAEATLIHVF